MLIIPILVMILPLLVTAQNISSTLSDGVLFEEAEQFSHNATLYEYYKKMQLYILNKSAEPMPKELKHSIEHIKLDFKAENIQFTKQDLVETINRFWRSEFIKKNPNPQEGLIMRSETNICDNGGFEDDFYFYQRYRSTVDNHWEKCDPTRNGAPVVWEFLPVNNSLYPYDYIYDFSIVSPGNDPLIPDSFGFNKVKFDDHSMRINNTKDFTNSNCGRGRRGINRITKDFQVDASHSKFGIWYSTILQDPDGSHFSEFRKQNNKPYFNIQFVDETDLVVEELCWDSTEDFFFDIINEHADCGQLYRNDTVKFQPWRCSIFDLSPYVGQNLKMEIITADCGHGAHFGYSYIDGICEACATIDLFFAENENCEALQVCGTYDLANGENTSLEIIQMTATLTGNDGSSATFPVTDIDQNNNSFCIDIPDDLIDLNTCYDIRVVGTFDDNVNLPFDVTSATVVTGQNNDFCGIDYYERQPLEYNTINTQCSNNGTSKLLNDDTYTITIEVLNPLSLPWSILKDTYTVLATGNTTQTVILGPLQYQDCNTLVIVNDFSNIYNYIELDIPSSCIGCANRFKVCDHQIVCEDNGTPNIFNDDRWSFTFVAESSDAGNFKVNNIHNFVGTYNSQYTLEMGELNNYGSSYTFEIVDTATDCVLLYDVELPAACKNCYTESEIIYSECQQDLCSNSLLYNVSLIIDPLLSDCLLQLCRKIDNNDCVPLEFAPTSYPILDLGLFAVQEGPWTLVINDCNGCQQEITIWPPDCDQGKPGQGGGGPIFDTGGFVEIENDDEFQFEFFPIPTTDILDLKTDMIDSEFEIHIFDTYGQEVRSFRNMTGDQKLNISAFKTGVYTVMVTIKNKLVYTDRIIKI